MHSSTSNSETRIVLRAIKVLLATVASVVLAMELGVRYMVPLVSWNTRRFHQERADVMAVGRDTKAGAGIVLLGNSLTYTDVDLDTLTKALVGTGQVHRWAIDDTNYLDWYYGLRRAFRAGARPRVVVIGARTNHLLARHVRGRFFARYIMDWKDLPDAACQTGADLNRVSGMVVARSSAFYGSREEIFKRCITLLLPRFPELGRVMASGGKTKRHWDRSALLRDRLIEVRDLCAKHGAQVVVWIPLTPDADPLGELAVEAGHKANVPVLVPGRQAVWSDADFCDGFHMTATASKRFTSLFAVELRSVLNQSAFAASADPGKELSLAK
jgi:hypothetical protein